MKDLEIRGAGNVLGAEQSGQIGAVGFDLYVRLLADAVAGLKALAKGEPPPPSQIVMTSEPSAAPSTLPPLVSPPPTTAPTPVVASATATKPRHTGGATVRPKPTAAPRTVASQASSWSARKAR